MGPLRVVTTVIQAPFSALRLQGIPQTKRRLCEWVLELLLPVGAGAHCGVSRVVLCRPGPCCSAPTALVSLLDSQGTDVPSGPPARGTERRSWVGCTAPRWRLDSPTTRCTCEDTWAALPATPPAPPAAQPPCPAAHNHLAQSIHTTGSSSAGAGAGAQVERMRRNARLVVLAP
jgi:hypothetical protein